MQNFEIASDCKSIINWVNLAGFQIQQNTAVSLKFNLELTDWLSSFKKSKYYWELKQWFRFQARYFSRKSTIVRHQEGEHPNWSALKSMLVATKLISVIIPNITFGLIAIHIFLKSLASTLVLTMSKAMNLIIIRISTGELPCVTNHGRCQSWSVDYYHNFYLTCSKSWKAARENKWIQERKNSAYRFSIVSSPVETIAN